MNLRAFCFFRGGGRWLANKLLGNKLYITVATDRELITANGNSAQELLVLLLLVIGLLLLFRDYYYPHYTLWTWGGSAISVDGYLSYRRSSSSIHSSLGTLSDWLLAWNGWRWWCLILSPQEELLFKKYTKRCFGKILQPEKFRFPSMKY